MAFTIGEFQKWRGGSDGSVLLQPVDQRLKAARVPGEIGVERGHQRWDAMGIAPALPQLIEGPSVAWIGGLHYCRGCFGQKDFSWLARYVIVDDQCITDGRRKFLKAALRRLM